MNARTSWHAQGAGDLPRIHLLPGTLHGSAEPSLVTTVLGSCVAVCLWDRVRWLAGMNYFVLPYRGAEAESLRYGDVAIDALVARMRELGSKLGDLDAKVFGGAAVLPTNSRDDNVGTQNVEIAQAWLHALRIPVVACRTGGGNGMALRLFTETGEVLVRRVKSMAVREANERACRTPD